MGHTSNTTLTSNSWIPVSEMTQVFTGTVSVVDNNVEITLTTPFNYNGTDNLIIAIDENKSGYNGSTNDFYSTNVTGQRSLLYRNDNTNPDPASPPTNTIGQNAIANIDIDFNATACNTPTALSVSNITTTSADLSWTAGGSETAWVIEYGVAGFTQGSGTTINANANNYSLTGLNPSTVYDAYVKSNCGSGNSSWVSYTFSTLCVPYSTPYFEGFESGYTHEQNISGCLSQEVVQGAVKWKAKNKINNPSALHIPRTGNWNAYFNSQNKTWLFIPIQLTGGTSYTVQLYSRYSSANTPVSKVEVKYGTAANASSMTNSIVDATTVTNSDYQKLKGSFTPSTSGVYYVGIYGQANSNFFGYLSIDDIKIIETPSCAEPENLTATNITATSANLGWTESASATTWKIEYGATGFTQGSGTTVTTTTNSHSLTGLTASTTYDFYVQADCGSGDTSIWVGPFSFTTSCAAINTFPYVEDFESITEGQPNCWNVAGTATTPTRHWYSYETGNQGRGMRFDSYYNTNGITSELTTPILDLTNLSEAELTFDFKNPTGGDFEILISTDAGTTYNSLDNSLTNQTDWTEKTYNITSYIGSNVKIQFKGTSNWGNGDAYIYLDNVQVKEKTSLSVNEVNVRDLEGVQIYPNPFQDVVMISDIKGVEKVSIVDMAGRLVKTLAPANELNLGELKSGMYLINLSYEDGSVKTVKAIKK